MKKVLIITYYWPPSGGSGVQRWLKYSKYLPEFGWQPVIYTPENPEPPAIDESLLADVRDDAIVLRRPITEPYRWYKRLTGRKGPVGAGFTRTDTETSESRLEKMSRWIRGNLFIPDARRFWIRPSVRYLRNRIRNHPVDAIITTGPPHSMHLIGKKLAALTGLPWVADFRDPWTGIDFYDDLMLTRLADRRHHKLERSVLGSADVVTTVSEHIRRELLEKGARRVEVIPNGFDPADVSDIRPAPRDPETFLLVHTGSLVPSRNPESLWKALGQCCKDNAEFRRKLRIRLVGSTDMSVRASIEKNGLVSQTEFLPYVPHPEALRHIFAADLLLLLINRTANAEGFLSGKVFEYLASGRPVLCIGPVQGDAARLLNETEAGTTLDYTDETGMIRTLKQYIKNRPEHASPNHSSQKRKSIEPYSRETQARRIAAILEDL